MPVIRIALLLIFTTINSRSIGQTTKQKIIVKQIWTAYVNQAQFSKHFGTWFALHLRTKENFVNDFSQLMAQGGLSYLTGNVRITAGYSFINFFPADNHLYISQPEHRPWQMIAWTNNSNRVRILHSFRLEERWRRKVESNSKLGDGYNFNYRAGYSMQFNFPLSKKGFVKNTLSFIASDELQINFGKEIINNYFDQNRIFVGFNFMNSSSSNMQLGYINGFQQLSAGTKYRKLHVIRIFYFHNMNLQNKHPHKTIMKTTGNVGG